MNSTIPSFSILLLISILFSSCPKPSVNPCDPNGANNLPAVSIESAMIMGNKIIVKGTITSIGNDLQDGVTAHGVVWSSDLSPTINDEVFDKGTAASTGPFTAELTGFSTGTINFRTYARNCAGIVYSNNLLSVDYSSGMLEIVSVALADDSNGNGIINNGETISYNFAVLNSGDVDANNVTIELNTNFPEYISNISPQTINMDNLNPQETSTLKAFNLTLSDDILDGEYCITLNISANSAAIESSSSICFNVQTTVDADFNITNNECFAPCLLTFDANSSTGNDLSFTWDFGDGSDLFMTSDAEAEYLYKKSGNYLVRLIAAGEGGADTISKSVEIDAITFKKKITLASFYTGGHGVRAFPVDDGYEIFGTVFNSNIGTTVLIRANEYGEMNPADYLNYQGELGGISANEIYELGDNVFYSANCEPSLGDIATVYIYDNMGNVLAQRAWVNEVCGSIQLVPLPNGNYFLVGINGGPFQGDGPIFAAELNSELQIIDSLPQPWGDEYSIFGLNALSTSDNRILIAADNELYQFNHFDDGSTVNLILLNTLPESVGYLSPFFQSPDGKLVFVINNTDGFNVIRYDLNGTLISQDQVISQNTTVNDAFVDENNDFLIIAGKKDDQAMIAKYTLSNLSESIWLETFSYIEGNSSARSVRTTPDGGYIMTGQIGWSDGGILIKTNHLGQVEE